MRAGEVFNMGALSFDVNERTGSVTSAHNGWPEVTAGEAGARATLAVTEPRLATSLVSRPIAMTCEAAKIAGALTPARSVSFNMWPVRRSREGTNLQHAAGKTVTRLIEHLFRVAVSC